MTSLQKGPDCHHTSDEQTSHPIISNSLALHEPNLAILALGVFTTAVALLLLSVPQGVTGGRGARGSAPIPTFRHEVLVSLRRSSSKRDPLAPDHALERSNAIREANGQKAIGSEGSWSTHRSFSRGTFIPYLAGTWECLFQPMN